ncbi:MAG: hypothetical protein LBC98_00800 [Prevotellaceae bacterium]|nr:hypothetical protein [Prevotellaceae bacterium]
MRRLVETYSVRLYCFDCWGLSDGYLGLSDDYRGLSDGYRRLSDGYRKVSDDC